MKKSLLFSALATIAANHANQTAKADPMTITTPTTALAAYRVEPNYCDCHVETCCCDPYVVVGPGGAKPFTQGSKKKAEEIAALLNELVLARRAAQPVAPEQDVLTIPKAIMEMPCAVTLSHFPTRHEMAAYKQGHRDARHAAADLVLARADELKALATPSPQIAEVAELPPPPEGVDSPQPDPDAEPDAEQQAYLDALYPDDPAPASAGQAAPASADAAGANEMRIALVTQLNELIDLGNRYAGRMRGKDDEESEYAQGACEYARRVMAPYNYNGGYRPTADEQDAKRYRYIATLRDWSDIEQMCWSSTARSASQFKHDLDKYIDSKLVNSAPDQACVMREVAMPKGLTRYSMWSNAAAHGMDPSPSGEWVAFDELQDYIAAQPAEGAGQAAPAMPDGWKVERNGECMRLTDLDGRMTNFSPMGGPSGKLAYEFLSAVLAARPAEGASQAGRQYQRKVGEKIIARRDAEIASLRAGQAGQVAGRRVEPDECAANMNGHRFGPHGRKGEIQCEWCGEAERAAAPAEPDGRDSGCRMAGGICACRSGGSFGGCARERGDCCTNEPGRQ